VRLIYSTEQQHWRTGRLNSKKQIWSEVSVTVRGICGVTPEEKVGYSGKDFAEKESFKPGVKRVKG